MRIEGAVAGHHGFAGSGTLCLTLQTGLVVRLAVANMTPVWNGVEMTVGEVCDRLIRRKADVWVVVTRPNGQAGGFTSAEFTTTKPQP